MFLSRTGDAFQAVTADPPFRSTRSGIALSMNHQRGRKSRAATHAADMDGRGEYREVMEIFQLYSEHIR
jgi:hypothetical protein